MSMVPQQGRSAPCRTGDVVPLVACGCQPPLHERHPRPEARHILLNKKHH